MRVATGSRYSAQLRDSGHPELPFRRTSDARGLWPDLASGDSSQGIFSLVGAHQAHPWMIISCLASPAKPPEGAGCKKDAFTWRWTQARLDSRLPLAAVHRETA